METFPKPWELIGLFEGEPEETDPGLDWKYNQLRFARIRGKERMECVIHQADREVSFRWSLGGVDVALLDLHDVTGLEVFSSGGAEGMLLTLGSERFEPIRIQIAPQVQIVVRDESR